MALSIARVAVVAAIPAVLVGNALWLLASDWFVELLYAAGAAGPATPGLTEPQRLELARAGVESIRPAGEGAAALLRARLPDGSPAFGAGEVAHMADVRELVRGFVVAWGAGVVVAATGGTLLVRAGGVRALARAALRGAGLTVAIMAGLGLFMLFAFETFFVSFHELFFAAGTWQFPSDSTLIRLFPYSFWTASGAAMAGAVLLQAGLLALASVRRGRARARRPVEAVA